ncbi:MAG: single-stranded-DNA-specific exonuclease RecJ [Clostridia bacterium]|nr:single-stranded-DNA-specific exonuclease RecJ [Clostridia bacterium]
MQFHQTFQFQKIDEKALNYVCQKYNLPKHVAQIMLMRGIDNDEKIYNFLHPNINQLNNPFEFKDMQEVTKRIKKAIEDKERVVIFGDYDVDGITSTYILKDYFLTQGLQVNTFLPNRYSDGYGLTIQSINKVINDFAPQLIITVDCGISSKNEVEYLRLKGVDVIITDHHECPDDLPNCLILDAKKPGESYPFAELCGAGVAFKLVEALAGRDFAQKYLPVAALATVSDIVPLVDENRAIVALGLSKGLDAYPLGIAMLAKELKIKGKLTSQDVSFKIAPKLNASGRMGDANHSLQLYIETNKTKLNQMIRQLIDYNTDRQELCNIAYEDCVRAIKDVNLADRKAIILSSERWNIGILGIVAARIVEEYNRPTFLLAKEGDEYKGSCRSVENMDVHAVLSQMDTKLLTSFGGHTMAGGMTVPADKIEVFKNELERVVERMYPADFFVPSYEYDLKVDIHSIDTQFIKSFEVLEPVGCQNPAPRFCVDFDKVLVAPMKNNPTHLTIQLPNLTLLAFNGAKQFNLISQSSQKSAIIELQTDEFRGVVSNKGIIKQLKLDSIPNIGIDRVGGEYIKQLALPSGQKPKFTNYDKNNINDLLASFGQSKYGTLIIANTLQGYRDFVENNRFKQNLVCYDYLYLSNVNGYNAICMCPSLNNDFSNFNNIVLLDGVLDEAYLIYLNQKSNACIYVPQNVPFIYAPFQSIDISRKVFAEYFNIFKRAIKADLVAFDDYNYFNKLKRTEHNINYVEFVACLETFVELGFIKVNDELTNYKLQLAVSTSAPLDSSRFYNKLQLIMKTY